MTDTLNASALTTLATVKEELGITGSASDNPLTRLINAASDQIQQFCDRTFYRQTGIVEKVAAFDDQFLTLKKTPINSITSITFDGSTVDSTAYEVHDANAGIIYSLNGTWFWTAPVVQEITNSPVPGLERRLYTVTYDAGWYTRKQNDDTPANTRTLPWDLEHACTLLVNHLFRRMGSDPSLASERLMSWGATYASASDSTGTSSGMPSDVETILYRYKRYGFA